MHAVVAKLDLALKFIYLQWLSPQEDRTIAQTRAFYAALSKAYCYPVIAPEGLINGRGCQALRPPRLADALGFFELMSPTIRCRPTPPRVSAMVIRQSAIGLKLRPRSDVR